jgi:hypothetical protein
MENQFEIEEIKTTSNISWDARQGRSKLLLNLLIMVINSSNSDDYSSWIRGLRSIHWICFPYVKKQEADKIKESIEECENWICQKGISQIIPRQKLNELMESIMFTYRNQFMQTTEESNITSFNPADILGGKR